MIVIAARGTQGSRRTRRLFLGRRRRRDRRSPTSFRSARRRETAARAARRDRGLRGGPNKGRQRPQALSKASSVGSGPSEQFNHREVFLVLSSWLAGVTAPSGEPARGSRHAAWLRTKPAGGSRGGWPTFPGPLLLEVQAARRRSSTGRTSRGGERTDWPGLISE
jgi:hypothetical protein